MTKHTDQSVKASAVEETKVEVQQRLTIVMLPPRPQMSTGHLLRVCTEHKGDETKLLWAKSSSHQDTAEINAARNEVIKTAGAKKIQWNLYETCYGSYRDARDNFTRDPLGVISKAMAPRPKAAGAVSTEDSF